MDDTLAFRLSDSRRPELIYVETDPSILDICHVSTNLGFFDFRFGAVSQGTSNSKDWSFEKSYLSVTKSLFVLVFKDEFLKLGHCLGEKRGGHLR